MTNIDHAIAKPPPGRAQRRIVGLFLAGLLQAALIYVIIVGLDIKVVWEPPKPPMTGEVILDRTKIPPPPSHPVVEPVPVTVPEPTIPVITYDDGPSTAITADTGPSTTGGPAAVPARGIMATHTTPPYPHLALVLGQQGTVMLRLTISPQGIVQNAVVVRSSGYAILDQAAQAWVVRQWRYHPATAGGRPVASTATVAVRFDLRNAG